jgi:hypothetical protein
MGFEQQPAQDRVFRYLKGWRVRRLNADGSLPSSDDLVWPPAGGVALGSSLLASPPPSWSPGRE